MVGLAQPAIYVLNNCHKGNHSTSDVTVQFQFFNFAQFYQRVLSCTLFGSPCPVNSRKSCELLASSVTLFTELFYDNTYVLGMWVTEWNCSGLMFKRAGF